jgi:hypothetical protein
VRLVAIGHSIISVIEAEKAPALIARIVFDIDICEGLSERVPATGSRRTTATAIHGAVGCGSRVEICTDIGFEHVRRCYDRDFKRVSIILFASATISSLRLFSRLVGLSGSAEAEPAE